jgi:hypothetical protein
MTRPIAFLLALAPALAWAGPFPSAAQCKALGKPTKPFAFAVGERLEYDLDAVGAEAGKLTFRVLPEKDGTLPVEAKIQTNTFFSKVRRVKATATSYLDTKSLRPKRYVEDAVENEVQRYADVKFTPSARQMSVQYRNAGKPGQRQYRFAQEGLDPAGSMYLLRQIPLKEGTEVCFDAYGIRSVWRVFGKVVGKEAVSLKAGEFQAWHLQGEAVRVDRPASRREIHIWISDDERRLPLAALGMMDLGVVRATLAAFDRPGEASVKAEGKETLKW